MLINLRQIEVFRAIMTTGSISGAARLLSVSQPAVSRMLSYTEDRLKLKLFERGRGRVQPTLEARKLFEEVEQLHQSVNRINLIAEELRSGSSGTVRIAASPSPAQGYVPAAIAYFRQKHPQLRVELEILSLIDLIDKVSGNRVDLGVSILSIDNPTLTVEKLHQGELAVIFPAGHELEALKAVGPEDLVPYGIIGYGPDTPYGAMVRRALRSSADKVRFHTIVRFTAQACALVHAGAGVAIVDRFALSGNAWPNIVARRLVPRASCDLRLISSELQPMSHPTRLFVRALREYSQRQTEFALLPAAKPGRGKASAS
ncbi:LysR family transcriptional regulator [Paracoccus suum]|uniref:LysR family transcriptional regulator n=1 Tax=Paracoccus suum TaxID=2259340 RepID=A0A344PLC9_9RHOB|nr:LysR family transcriptional regulator [Paracoccus suum]AXC50184.1 LysR family transcriptional regulator [Paracoccus suum]